MQDDRGAGTALAPEPSRVLGSDPHAFAGLYIRHRTSFTSHARRYLRDPRDADEVVQEAFLRLFLALPELETELQALAYCRRTITNLCIDRYRADARRPRLVALEGPNVDELAETDTGDPVVRAEDAALVRAALSQLPELHRAALVKREIEEKPLPVIADELDVAEDSVKHLLFRARRALRKLLAGTAVAPGVDVELTRGLRPAARGASSGVAGLLLLALLGLGSGPDLRAVPVVGVDLPDVLGVTTIADAVGDAVREVVRAIVPGDEVHATTGNDGPSRTADRPQTQSDAEPPTTTQSQPGQPASGATPRGATGRAPGVADGPLPSTGRPSTVVTIVDGVPVVSVLPPARDVPSASVPVPGARPAAPGTSTGRGPGPVSPAAVPPATVGAGVDVVPGRTPDRPVVTVPAPGAPAIESGSAGRPTVADGGLPKADAAVERAAEKAAGKAAEPQTPVEKAADKAAAAADRAAAAADRAEQKTEKANERAADKAEQVVDKAVDRAPDKAVDKAPDKAAANVVDKAADKAELAAARAADKAAKAANDKAAKAANDKAADKAAERAAARAAELAAAQAAAERAAAAAAAVPVVATP